MRELPDQKKMMIILDLRQFLIKNSMYLNYILSKYPFIDTQTLLTSMLKIYSITDIDFIDKLLPNVTSVYYLDKYNLDEDIDFITSVESMYMNFIEDLFDMWYVNKHLAQRYNPEEHDLIPEKFLDKYSLVFKVIKVF